MYIYIYIILRITKETCIDGHILVRVANIIRVLYTTTREKDRIRKIRNLQVSIAVGVRLRVAATVCYIGDNLSTDMLMDGKRQEPTATRSLPKSLMGHDCVYIIIIIIIIIHINIIIIY